MQLAARRPCPLHVPVPRVDAEESLDLDEVAGLFCDLSYHGVVGIFGVLDLATRECPVPLPLIWGDVPGQEHWFVDDADPVRGEAQ